MTLTRIQRKDYVNIDRTELKLIRVGHAIWAILRRERRLKMLTAREEMAILEAVEIIVDLKRRYRAELRERRVVAGNKMAEYFKTRKQTEKDRDDFGGLF